jgi:hypothetical protein
VTETRTARFGLPLWSAGTDGPSRSDFDEAFTNIEARAAYDDGVTVSALPSTSLYQGRYVWQQTASGNYRTLWRRDDASGWYHVGGPVIPTTQLIRALVNPPLADQTLDAVRIEHPTLDTGGWAANVTFDGAGVLRRGLALGHPSDTTLGRLTVGGNTLPASTVRAQMTAYAANEHVLLLKQAYSGGGTPGSLLRMLNQAGSAVVDIDGTGKLAASQPSAFGGANLSTGNALSVAPTVSGADTNGLALYGQASAGTKALLGLYRDSGDSVPIGLVARNGITLGRTPWGTAGTDGTVTLAGNLVYVRSSSNASNTTWLALRYTSLANEADITQDTNYFTTGPAGWSARLPGYHSQELLPATPTMTLYRFLDFSLPFLTVQRATRSGSTVTTTQVGSWEADGRMQVGVPWRGLGTQRDVRQNVVHTCTKAWVNPGDSPTAGQVILTNQNYNYTWPDITVKSLGTTDLEISVLTELMMGSGVSGSTDGQNFSHRLQVSINGGSFADVDRLVENAQATTNAGNRQVGDLFDARHLLSGVAAGTVLRFKSTLAAGNGLATVYLRSAKLRAHEQIVETYVAL